MGQKVVIPRKAFWLKLISIILFAGLAVLLATQFNLRDLLREGLERIGHLGAWGPVIFILVYIVASVLFLPASVLTIGAGALFGIVRGSLYVIVGATLGATAAFLVGRYLARDWVSHRLERNEKFKAIDEAVGREGIKIVLLTRLSPVLPFNVLNYAFGVSKVDLRSYVVASAIGMLPGTLMYVYIGALAGDVAIASGEHQKTPAEWTLLTIGFIATIAVTILITRVARAALRSKINA